MSECDLNACRTVTIVIWFSLRVLFCYIGHNACTTKLATTWLKTYANLHKKNRMAGVSQSLVEGGQKSSQEILTDEVITLWEKSNDEAQTFC